MRRLLFGWLAVVAMLAVPWTGVLADAPNDALICLDEPIELTPGRYLRALSLDLRGRLPTTAEAESFTIDPTDGAHVAATIDTLLDDESFADEVVRRHRTYFWPNLANVRILGTRQDISVSRGLWWDRDRARTYRPDGANRHLCADRPATFGPNGEILTEPNEDGVLVDGWVEVEPYWAPDTTIRVCAFLAQTRRYSNSGADCSLSANEPDCGCGPNMIWCAPGFKEGELRRSFADSFERVIRRAIGNDASYLELFESRQMDLNGPLTHFFRHLARTARTPFNPLPLDLETLPDLDPADSESWVTMELPPAHAGLLTHPVFLLRFQTNRARASRFYEAFLCSPFQPPPGGLPASDDNSAWEPDLQKRTGCKYCHSLLEPAASHWGRWNEQGGGFFHQRRYPATNDECYECATTSLSCSRFCRDNYLTRALDPSEEPYLGMLKAYAFRREEHLINVEQGPKLLARTSVASHRLPRCVAQKTAEWLLGRDMNQPGDMEWVEDISRQFVRDGFSYRGLVKSVVRSDRYRRVQ
jgi:hypothetical protein